MSYLNDLHSYSINMFSLLGILKANDVMRPGSGRPSTAGDRGLVSSGIGGMSYQSGGKNLQTNYHV